MSKAFRIRLYVSAMNASHKAWRRDDVTNGYNNVEHTIRLYEDLLYS